MFKLSERMERIPPYLFAEIDAMKNRKIQEGVEVIDFGVGDPDLPTPEHIVEAMKLAVERVERQKYPSYEGMLKFRESVANFYRRRKGVKLDPENEVVALIGSKEGIAHLPLAFVNRGDIVLVPEPGYPVYFASTLLADGKPYEISLKEENNFLPDLESIPDEIASRAKIMFLNYPNNPTAAIADKEFIKEVIDFCIDRKIILAHDAAYSEITFDGYRAPSFLEFDNAFEVTIEFNSLSKTYNMTGWRIGFACGNPDILSGLLKVKTNVDSGVFEAIQEAAIAAMDGPDEVIERNCEIYRKRRDLLVEGLNDVGFDVKKPLATFYVWAKVNGNSIEFVKKLLDAAGIVATPGVGFGKSGEGYVRFALTRDENTIKEAINRLKDFKF
ncbi:MULTISPECIES: LL-diaminopimelate aminotransferase [unclassified Archaeoglobus]|uniref:LL-diaminopimelate aminotransferase n=1 Tax=unclassified Archaeoglobus TaxID=2643606 RepID=UPI0025BF8E4A|nr:MULTISPECIES: LL-diaminopimelate aminotransferase [unclassified Archaeoglobus]